MIDIASCLYKLNIQYEIKNFVTLSCKKKMNNKNDILFIKDHRFQEDKMKEICCIFVGLQ